MSANLDGDRLINRLPSKLLQLNICTSERTVKLVQNGVVNVKDRVLVFNHHKLIVTGQSPSSPVKNIYMTDVLSYAIYTILRILTSTFERHHPSSFSFLMTIHIL